VLSCEDKGLYEVEAKRATASATATTEGGPGAEAEEALAGYRDIEFAFPISHVNESVVH
jgi:hypothetical protein